MTIDFWFKADESGTLSKGVLTRKGRQRNITVA